MNQGTALRVCTRERGQPERAAQPHLSVAVGFRLPYVSYFTQQYATSHGRARVRVYTRIGARAVEAVRGVVVSVQIREVGKDEVVIYGCICAEPCREAVGAHIMRLRIAYEVVMSVHRGQK